MKFPTLKTFARATFSQEEEYHWRQGLPFQPPAAFPRPWGAFAEHIARKYYEGKGELWELERSLKWVFSHDLSPEKPPRDRRRIVFALELIAAHLGKQGLNAELVSELFRFCYALEDLDRGTVHFSLARNVAGSRPVLGSDVWEIRAYVAIAIDLLIAIGNTKSGAAKKATDGLGRLKEVVATDASKIIRAAGEWHSMFVDKTCNDKRAQDRFDDRANYLRFMSQKTGLSSENLALAVINHAKSLASWAVSPDAAAKMSEDGP